MYMINDLHFIISFGSYCMTCERFKYYNNVHRVDFYIIPQNDIMAINSTTKWKMSISVFTLMACLVCMQENFDYIMAFTAMHLICTCLHLFLLISAYTTI